MPTYFLLDPFEFPYYFYRIRGELIQVLSIYIYIYIYGQYLYIYIYIYIYIKPDICQAVRETWVRSQVESYKRLKKWYLMPPCLTLSIIRYGSRVKWSNPGKVVAPSPTPWCSKLSEREPSGHPRLWSPTLLLLIYIYIYIYIYIFVCTLDFCICID